MIRMLLLESFGYWMSSFHSIICN